MTDLEALTAVARTTSDLADRSVFPGEAEFLREFRELSIESGTFRIEFWLQQDVLAAGTAEERTMIVLRFTASGQTNPASRWEVRVRGDWPERRDRFARVGPLAAKKLRKAFAPRRRRLDPLYPNLPTHDDVYLMLKTPPDDLMAQLCLFALQTALSTDPELMTWLEDYLVRNFRFKVRDRLEVARDMVLRLLRYKWWIEDARAWRKYVAIVLRAAERPYQRQGATGSDIAADPRDTENQLIRMIDGTDDEPGPERSAARRVAPCDATGSVFTVEEASRQGGKSRSTLYSEIQQGRLAVEYDAHGRMMIPRAEVERLAGAPTIASLVAAVSRVRRCSESTARRYVSRLRKKGYSFDALAQEYGVRTT